MRAVLIYHYTREIPPRARRRVWTMLWRASRPGNTSACAEKRGTRGLLSAFSLEIPPRARRRGGRSTPASSGSGNTSACAEKSDSRPYHDRLDRKYLRVRGEEPMASSISGRIWEIPPRARRRGLLTVHLSAHEGNTSACAEKSPGSCVGWRGRWKYLRVRGEELRGLPSILHMQEIPPRARRREHNSTPSTAPIGNTSACAEKS